MLCWALMLDALEVSAKKVLDMGSFSVARGSSLSLMSLNIGSVHGIASAPADGTYCVQTEVTEGNLSCPPGI